MKGWLNGELKKTFEAAREKAWTLGYASMNEELIDSGPLKVEGSLPKDLRGVLYRNGPARHERGQGRYTHMWDGDGMVQAFTFANGGISHRGRYVKTTKYAQESNTGRFELSAFGSAIASHAEMTMDIDDMNVANINVCVHNEELLALWEPGSAYALSLDSLETRGIKTWDLTFGVRPFSAHPKVEPDGFLWNFGCDSIAQTLHVYGIAAHGEVVIARQFHVDDLPPVHDFAVTRDHLVFVLSPLDIQLKRLAKGRPFGAAVSWMPGDPTRVLSIDKRTWTLRWHELPPMIFSHMGNAWEDDSGVIRFDCVCGSDPRWMAHGWSLMRGDYQHVQGAVMTRVELRPDGGSHAHVIPEIEAEFPVVDPRSVGQRHRAIACIRRSATRPATMPGWDSVASVGADDLEPQSFAFGDDWMVEEHVYAPDAARPGMPAKWLVGTALDLRAGCTVLSVFAADAIAAGPVAQVRLPYALPLGLHGTFHPSASG